MRGSDRRTPDLRRHRRLGGAHPFGVPVFVVTHSVPAGWPRDNAPFTFVLDGIESAVRQAQQVAGNKAIGVAGPIAQQYLEAGLLDEVWIELVPVIFGRGIRFFDDVQQTPVMLENPTVIEGDRVTHLMYAVRK